jgi:lipoprotein LpqH
VPAAPAKRSRVGLIIGLIALVLIVGVITAAVIGFVFLRKTITDAAHDLNSATTSRTSTARATPATVTVDGQAVPVSASPVCVKAGDLVSISIDPSHGIAASLSGEPPTVQSVSLGTVNGVTLAYSGLGTGDDSATVTQDGNTFSIRGTATGVDFANDFQTVNKPFDIHVTCPHF